MADKRRKTDAHLCAIMWTHKLTRKQMSRVLFLYGAFTASDKMLRGDDAGMLRHLQKLRTTITDDERGPALDCVMRNLKRLMASEATPRARARSAKSRRPAARP